MGKYLIVAAYTVYAVFWMRFFMHTLVWWRALKRINEPARPRLSAKACAATAGDIFFFGRLIVVNPALWFGEWVFHASFLLVLLRHLRYFLNPVPDWVWSFQTPGMIAGYILPVSLLYILAVRLLTKRERYASRANIFLLGLVLVISSLGVAMHEWFKPNIVDVKLFILGIVCFKPAPAPESALFIVHFSLFLVLVLFLPTHIFTAPLIMFEARKREQSLHGVIHEPEKR